MTTQKDLEYEIKELQLEIESGKQTISTLHRILERKEQQLKEMNDAHRNTNEAVENKRKEHLISDLQSKNWYVNMREFAYPKLEVIDENTVRIEGVKYQKVDEVNTLPPKPPTLLEIIREWNDDDDDPPCEVLVDMICDWIPDELEYEENEIGYNQGWNDCLGEMKENLK